MRLRRARRTRLGCAVLAVDLSNYHADILFQQHGREAADRALVLAAARLIRGVARDVDTVSRTGAQPVCRCCWRARCCPDKWWPWPRRRVAHGLRPSPRLPPAGVTLKLSHRHRTGAGFSAARKP
jgi:hypothetical protein